MVTHLTCRHTCHSSQCQSMIWDIGSSRHKLPTSEKPGSGLRSCMDSFCTAFHSSSHSSHISHDGPWYAA
jgi:hypothetical protein